MIGKQICNLRKQKGCTQAQFAKMIGVSLKTVKNWENEVTDPSVQNLITICEVGRITADELLVRNTHAMIDISGLPEEKRKLLTAIVQLFMKS